MQNKTMQLKGFTRFLALLLCAAMLLPLPMWEAEAGEATAKHGVTTVDKVLFRKEALDGADHYGYFSIGQVLEILGTATGSGRTWYKVKGQPITPQITYTGYVRGDVFRPLTDQEEANFISTGSIVTGAPSVTSSIVTAAPNSTYTTGYVRITQTRTNLRTKPDGSSFLQLDKNVILPCYGEEIVLGAYRWIYVLDTKTNNYGYVRSDCYQFVDSLGNPTAGPGTQPSGPSVPSTPQGNYAIVTVDAANLRQTPGGIGLLPMAAGSVISITGTENSGWYPAQFGGYTGYVSAGHIRFMTAAELAAYLADGTVPGADPNAGPAPVQGYVRITAVRVNLRDRPDGSSLLQMDKDQIIPYYGNPQYKNGVAWQYVYYTPARVYGYVHQDFFRYTDQNGNAASTPTPPPQATPQPGSVSGYVKLVKPGVNLRTTPGGNSIAQLPANTLLPFEGVPIYAGGYSWVRVTEPVTRRTGYVRSDCYQFVDASGNPTQQPDVPTPVPPIAPTAAPGTASGTLTLIKGGVNLRIQPSGGIIARLDKGIQLNYYGVAQKDGYTWYYVQSDRGYGYIRGDMANVTPGSGSQPGITPAPDSSYGYLITLKSNVNLRKLPDGLTLMQLAKARVYPITAAPVYKGGYNWYFVQAEGHTGYLRGDCVRQLSAAETADYLNNGTVPPLTPSTPDVPNDGTVGHIITTMNAVNVRVSPSLDASVTAQVNIGTVMPYKTTMSTGGNMWYQVVYNGLNAYVLSSTARIMTAQEYEAWKNGQPAPTPTATPKPEELSNVAVTLMDKVLLRREGSMSAPTLTVLYKAGTRVDLLGATAVKDGYNWYSVRGANVTGWVRADMVRILSKAEAGGNGSTPGGTTPGGNTNKPIVTYRTLRKGMSGADVTALQNALIQLGLLPQGSATGVYTTQTEAAVREYQKAANLFVDGVAGQRTQNALYNTSAPNEGGGSTVDTTIYPVEIVDWYTGDIQAVWGKGVTATITDVKTGISFRAKRWSGGYHADVEPLTAADTAAMCRIYGVSRAQEISDRNLYQRRALWVTLSGRTFAASMYGVPHNYPQGDTISNNDYYGQFCVHFYNSRTHSSGRVDSDHMAAIRYAYDHAPSKK